MRTIAFLLFLTFQLAGQTSSLDSLLTALTEHSREDSVRAELFRQIAIEYRNSDFQKVAEYADSTLELAQKLQNPHLLYRAYNIKGLSANLFYKPVESFEYYLKARDLCLNRKDYEWRKRHAQILINISSCFWLNGANQVALDYSRQARKLLRELNEPEIELSTDWAMGLLHFDLEKPDSALYYFENARNGFILLEDTIKAAILQNQLGQTHLELGNDSIALNHYTSAFNFLGRNELPTYQLLSATGLGATYFKLGELELAHYYCQLSNKLAQQTNSAPGTIRKNAKILAEIFSQWNQLDSAYYYQDLYIREKNEEIKEEKTKISNRLELEYKLREKEYQNELLARENQFIRSQNLLYFVIFLSLLVSFVLAVFFLRQFYQKNQKIREQYVSLEDSHQQLQRLTSEKKHLVSLLTHDLRTPLMLIRLSLNKLTRFFPPAGHNPYFNSLENIHAAANKIDQLSQRIIATEHLENELPALELTQIVPDALLRNICADFQNLAQNKHIELHLIEQEQPLPAVQADPFLLKLAIGNLVSNAIKYAPEDTTVEIGAGIKGDSEFIFVKDEGPGLPEKVKESILSTPEPGAPLPHRPQSENLNLGLYLTRRYVEAMGAKLLLDPLTTSGTSMVIAFPRAKQDSGKAPVASHE